MCHLSGPPPFGAPEPPNLGEGAGVAIYSPWQPSQTLSQTDTCQIFMRMRSSPSSLSVFLEVRWALPTGLNPSWPLCGPALAQLPGAPSSSLQGPPTHFIEGGSGGPGCQPGGEPHQALLSPPSVDSLHQEGHTGTV